MTPEEPVHRADPDGGATLNQPSLNLDQGHVSLLRDQLPDEATMCLDLARMPVTAARPGHSLTKLKGTLPPADRARYTDPEAGRRGAAAQPAINRCDNSVPKIL